MFAHSDASIHLLVNARIEAAEREIARQRDTIEQLEAEGHEVTDAKKHLAEMLASLIASLRPEEGQPRA